MKYLMLLSALIIFSTVYGQESNDTLTYARTEIIVPEGCSAKSNMNSKDVMDFLLNGFI